MTYLSTERISISCLKILDSFNTVQYFKYKQRACRVFKATILNHTLSKFCKEIKQNNHHTHASKLKDEHKFILCLPLFTNSQSIIRKKKKKKKNIYNKEVASISCYHFKFLGKNSQIHDLKCYFLGLLRVQTFSGLLILQAGNNLSQEFLWICKMSVHSYIIIL